MLRQVIACPTMHVAHLRLLKVLTCHHAAAAPGGAWGPASSAAAAGGAWSRCWAYGAGRCWRCRPARTAAVAEQRAALQGGRPVTAARGAGAPRRLVPAQRPACLAQQLHRRCRWHACCPAHLFDHIVVLLHYAHK